MGISGLFLSISYVRLFIWITAHIFANVNHGLDMLRAPMCIFHA